MGYESSVDRTTGGLCLCAKLQFAGRDNVFVNIVVAVGQSKIKKLQRLHFDHHHETSTQECEFQHVTQYIIVESRNIIQIVTALKKFAGSAICT